MYLTSWAAPAEADDTGCILKLPSQDKPWSHLPPPHLPFPLVKVGKTLIMINAGTLAFGICGGNYALKK